VEARLEILVLDEWTGASAKLDTYERKYILLLFEKSLEPL
jgi:hypothetical protein